MDHLLEVLKIVDGALNADISKVYSYSELLAEKLQRDGDLGASTKIRNLLSQAKGTRLNAASLRTGANLPVDSESRLALGDREIIPAGQTKVFLDPAVHRRCADFLEYVRAADRLVSKGVVFSPSLLLYGPPGCGKTELARYLASELQLPLVTARIDSLVSSFLGSTAKNLRSIFDYASSNPCVLFLDEFDAIAKIRDDKYELGELKRVVVSLLQNIDKLDKHTILIAATNHEHLLDPAIWRRFTYKAQLSYPSELVRKNLFQYFLSEFSAPDSAELFAAITDRFTGAEIREICEDSKRHAVISNSTIVKESDVLRRALDLQLIKQGKQPQGVEDSLKTLRGLNPKIFTYRRLSEMFDISLGHISNVLKEG